MISIFTPSHNPAYLDEVLSSLRDQTSPEWEWVVLLNNGAAWCCDDPRVRVVRDDTKVANVGYLKRIACSHATGDVLLELDHDDLLFPTAIEEVGAAFGADPSAVFVYSNAVCHDVRTDTPITWSSRFGWSDRPCTFRGKEYRESVSADPHPQSISRIWFAPNHLRAWRRDAYWAIGGHNGGMKISDDHEMMLRTWLHGRMVHIDKPLYLYRVDGNNTWLANQDEIQTTMWGVHDRYIGAMAEKWARDNGLRIMDLCSGPRPPAGYEGLDLRHDPVTTDLNERWPMEDNSVGVLRAVDAVEHLHDPIHTMNEACRVLAHGGFLFVAVPSTNGLGAWADPTHVSFWNAMSFDYYTHPQMRAYIEPAAKCKFQAIKVMDGTITSVTGRVLPYTFAHLVALKADRPRFYGENFWENPDVDGRSS